MMPFIEIPVCLAGSNDLPEKEVTGRLQPSEIANYYPGYHWGTIIIIKSGSSFLTKCDPEEIDTLLLEYSAFAKKNSNKFGFVKPKK